MKKNKRIGLATVASLVFSFMLMACGGGAAEAPRIEWKDQRATGLRIPLSLFDGLRVDSIKNQLRVYIGRGEEQPVLGDYTMDRFEVTFKPLIAFSEGLTYEVRLREKVIAEIEVPVRGNGKPPEILSIYPHRDTVPSNLLKMYIRFSKPMREGEALQHISLLKRTSENAPPVFLDLQPELWNADRTMLTLWLDPGRIKRDLQPNQSMGPPLEQGFTYHLKVNKYWYDTEGERLEWGYIQDYFVGQRDSISPDINRWTFILPKKGTMDPLKINLHESLDYVLLKEAMRITDANGVVLKGDIEVTEKERIWLFKPAAVWKTGNYNLECESRLEDLAGNNLNRLFDRDITQKDTTVKKDVFKRAFRIE